MQIESRENCYDDGFLPEVEVVATNDSFSLDLFHVARCLANEPMTTEELGSSGPVIFNPNEIGEDRLVFEGSDWPSKHTGHSVRMTPSVAAEYVVMKGPDFSLCLKLTGRVPILQAQYELSKDLYS